jgi:acetyl esterase
MSMDYAPGLEAFIDRCKAALPPDFYTFDLAEQRRLYDRLSEVFPYDISPSVTVSEHRAFAGAAGGRGIRCRVYEPAVRHGNGCVLYMRGGGFVIGSLDSHHALVADLAERSGLLCVALDFRMAPEHPFPVPVEDCYLGLVALVSGAFGIGASIEPSQVVVAGDSSGANMAVAMSMMARDRHGPAIAGMALLSPVLDFTRWQHGGEDTPLLTGGEMEYYTACYCPLPGQVSDPLVSPLVSGSFDNLPPAYIMGAGLDSLRTDGLELARRLSAAGIAVEHALEPGMMHSPVRARAYSPPVADAWLRFCLATRRLAQPASVARA